MWQKICFLLFVFIFTATNVFAQDEVAVCYNCPPEWAGWGNQLELIKKEIGITVPMDNKNSGQSVSQLIAEKNNPIADVSYLGISFAINAMNEDVIIPYKGPGWESVPDGLKDPDGYWVAIHSGSLGLMINVDALEGKPIPKGWNDLLDPQYKGMVGFLDPGSAFVGYVGAVAINQALGGNLDNFDPAIKYFQELKKNDPIIPKQTAYARVISGEIPILFDYDFNAYRAKYTDKANIEFVIPTEGSILVPYAMTLVKNAPHESNGKKVIDFVLSDKGQRLWAENFLRPVHTSAITPEIAALFLPESDYQRVTSIDYAKMANVQAAFSKRYLEEVE
ncbi:MAG: ABC transporter substrate-binding protein [Endomicrobium sp.]|nr:ABC transporter substrate-binding protein [Endomicrobium sp.]